MPMNASPRVLIVDDDAAAREAQMRLLRKAGYAVCEAGTGEDALRLLASERVDLALVDIVLPGIDGLEVCRRMRQAPASSFAFIVLCTAMKSTPADIAAGYEAGADGYLLRPIGNDLLLAQLQGFLRHKRTLDLLRASKATYQALFEGSPLPIWIVSENGRNILAANLAALCHSGYTHEEARALDLAALLTPEEAAQLWLKSASKPGEMLVPQTVTLHRKDGFLANHAELYMHRLDWLGEPARALVIVDISARLQLEDEQARQQRARDGEMRSLSALSSDQETRVTANAYGLSPLSRAAPHIFAELRASYDEAIALALQQRIFRAENSASPVLREIAERLYFLLAGPRDVVEMHYAAMKARMEGTDSARAQGYLEAGRLAVLELMGYLAAAYRNSHIATQKPASV